MENGLLSKTFTGLPEDIELLSQLWQSLIDARVQRLSRGGHTPNPAEPAPVTEAPAIDPSLMPPPFRG